MKHRKSSRRTLRTPVSLIGQVFGDQRRAGTQRRAAKFCESLAVTGTFQLRERAWGSCTDSRGLQ